MNIFSEQKNREFEAGFLGEKNYEISFRNLKSPTLKLSLDMHHLSLNKQSNIVGQRNQKYFNSLMTLKDAQSGRKIKAHISPYSQQNYDFQVSQPIQINSKWKAGVMASVTNACKGDLASDYKSFSFGGSIKSNKLKNNILFSRNEEKRTFDIEYSVRFFNYDKYEINKKAKHSASSIEAPIEETENGENKSDKQDNQNNSQEQSTQVAVIENRKTENPFKFELSLHFKTINFSSLEGSIFADLLFKKYEGVLSANFAGKSLKGLMCLFRYNSSLWLKLTSNTNELNQNNKGGVELVYQHDFNKYIQLKNYINSNYTIATQLSYHPSELVTLIYSATINIQKFKQESEDYKVGYGIHINF